MCASLQVKRRQLRPDAKIGASYLHLLGSIGVHIFSKQHVQNVARKIEEIGHKSALHGPGCEHKEVLV